MSHYSGFDNNITSPHIVQLLHSRDRNLHEVMSDTTLSDHVRNVLPRLPALDNTLGAVLIGTALASM